MKKIVLLLLCFPSIAFSQRRLMDTLFSQTKIYTALNVKNSFFKKEEYEVAGKKDMVFDAIVLHDIGNATTTKGAILYARPNLFGFYASPHGPYLDETEITGIIKILKYILDNINLDEKVANATAVYYKTIDDFEVGVRAKQNKRYEIYFAQNHLFQQTDINTMDRNDLREVYESFILISDFLKAR